MKQTNLASIEPTSVTEAGQTLAELTAARIRERVISGMLSPGSHLSEAALCEELQVSRNTLREVFRLLTKEGLLRHEANRGVFVSTPSISTIMDIFHIRRLIECSALASAHHRHPSVDKMRAAIEAAVLHRDRGEWLEVGSADIAFHAAIVELADSPRLSAFYAQISLELRLVFGLIRDPEYLHAPYVGQNATILAHLEEGAPASAADALEKYLFQAERFILGAYSRAMPG
ncbi:MULTISPECIES: GntR family transcriptional regulator [unclassified Rhizobium]|uniref:GntR family transcriptional regulator n=1 Tax=Rhizobium TaxID=379 RepID=UPI00084CAF09|nr:MULTISPECIES: GntR family transcriptional regulator [unclassified Rhizobium]OED01214.1 GntR family transcriptional regulator [Rhizobium sp. YK2]QYA15734.1 GntR family transcriptional regulator [Rhizobium sp. AB2/73]UEQ83399.1 GntR family transcriptional regulator [Rhizobium sp. AB2/73]